MKQCFVWFGFLGVFDFVWVFVLLGGCFVGWVFFLNHQQCGRNCSDLEKDQGQKKRMKIPQFLGTEQEGRNISKTNIQT